MRCWLFLFSWLMISVVAYECCRPYLSGARQAQWAASGKRQAGERRATLKFGAAANCSTEKTLGVERRVARVLRTTFPAPTQILDSELQCIRRETSWHWNRTHDWQMRCGRWRAWCAPRWSSGSTSFCALRTATTGPTPPPAASSCWCGAAASRHLLLTPIRNTISWLQFALALTARA